MANPISYANKINELTNELPDFVMDFIYNFSTNNSNYNTKLEYCRDIKCFLEYLSNYTSKFADKPIKDFTLEDIDQVEVLDINRYLTILGGPGNELRKQSTVKRKRASLSSMYSFFLNSGKIHNNPVLVTSPGKKNKKELIYLTNEEQKTLLNGVRNGNMLSGKACSEHELYEKRDSALFLLLLDTGLRVSEMLNTDISDYDLDNCSVLVTRKGGDHQNVYYSDECAEYLAEYFGAQRVKYGLKDKDIPAFTTTTGKRLGSRAVEMLVKKYMEAYIPARAKEISPHKLRSSFAMSFYEASGNNILLLKEKLNHSSIQTTNIYAEASKKDLKDSRNILEGLR